MLREKGSLWVIHLLILILTRLRLLCRLTHILSAKKDFTCHDVVITEFIGILDHVHKCEEHGRTANARLTVYMDPCRFWQFLVNRQEVIHILRGRRGVVHDRDAVVLHALRFQKFAFRLDGIHLFLNLIFDILI